ncbi:MAG TPA: tRNA lysidine(34) synthetase TilS [Candidatus Anaerofilum faecale]|nr:tRNA lysidine(34) synthetase TilS [Candidatus Anaerofilum faecale]
MSEKEAFEQKVFAQIGRFSMLRPGDTVAAAVSGGADSVALLAALLALSERLDVRVTAVHVNHGLRGEEADRDEAFVRALCRRRGVPLTVCRAADMNCTPPSAGQEEWARRLRYGCFERLAASGCRIATAHTADDQAETLLFRLARGAGLHGSAGIPPVRLPFIRPLLTVSRAEVEGYCAACGLDFVQDSTNESALYARNRLRQAAIPALRGVNTAAVEHLAAFCEEMRALDAYLADAAANLLENARAGEGWRASVLADAPGVVRRAALAQLCGQQADRLLIDRLEGLVLGRTVCCQLPGGQQMRRTAGVLRRETPAPLPADPPPGFPLREGEYHFPGGFCVKIWCESGQNANIRPQVHKKVLNSCADCDKIPDDTVLRTPRPGDRFWPIGRGLSKPLRRFLQEQGVPAGVRPLLPVLASGSRVLWIYGQGFGCLPGHTGRTGTLCIRAFCSENKEETK